ncbi:MAG: sulfite exporter TauE/SafE family protein [Chloroflexota bacterium]
MPIIVYLVGVPVVLFFSAVLSMAGLGAAFLFVPFFYWLGVPLDQAMPTALLLNFVSLAFASIIYMRSKIVDFRAAVPIAVTAVILSPLGALTTHLVDKNVLLWLFGAFLLFAGSMMLFYKAKAREVKSDASTTALSAGVGGIAGFFGGLLGIGGGNFIVPVLNWLGFDPKVAAGTTAFVVVFASLAGFLGHVSFGGLDYAFLAVMALASVGGALLGAYLMRYKLSSAQLKRIIGLVLYGVAAKIIWGLIFV